MALSSLDARLLVQVLGFVFCVLGFGFCVLGFGFWVLGFGFWVLGFGFWVLGFGFWVLVLGFGVLGFGFWVWGLGFGVWGFGFWVLGSWFTVCGLCAGEHPEGLQRGAEGQDGGGTWQGRESGCVMCCIVLQPKTRVDKGWLVGGWEPCVDGEEKEDDGS